MLSKKHVKDVCLCTNHNADPEDVCRYCQHGSFGEFNCVKLSKGKKVADVDIASQIANGADPCTIPYSGDNCQGYPYLRHVKQGYDV
jgi:hypothetical protein